MKKTLITLLALAGVAGAANVTWIGAAGDGNWSTAGNWSKVDSTTGETKNEAPGAGDTVSISDATVTRTQTGGSDLGGDGDQAIKLTVSNGAVVYTDTNAVSSSYPNAVPRFRTTLTVDETSKLITSALFLYGENNIFGTVEVKNVFDPGASSVTVNFGESGIIKYQDGSMNGIEGNKRTLTLGAVLDTGILGGEDTTYTLVTRYLIQGDSGKDFNTAAWQSLTLAAGSITGTGGMQLTSATGNIVLNKQDPNDPNKWLGNKYTGESVLTASAADFGKYQIGADANGIYVQYVKSSVTIPEPATATLSLLALAGLAARRRRK